jgi:hypothetical protein
MLVLIQIPKIKKFQIRKDKAHLLNNGKQRLFQMHCKTCLRKELRHLLANGKWILKSDLLIEK